MTWIKNVMFVFVGISMVDLISSNIPIPTETPKHSSSGNLLPCWNTVLCDKKQYDNMVECLRYINSEEEMKFILRILKKTLKTDTIESQTEAYCELTDEEKEPKFDEMVANIARKEAALCSNAYKYNSCNNWGRARDCCWQILDEVHDLNLC